MFKIGEYTFTSIETIQAFDFLTGNFMFELDELQNATMAQTEETADVTGKNGRKITVLRRNKGATVSATNALVSAGLMSAQIGSEFENKATIVRWSDYLTVASGKATTKFTAVGTTGAEIIEILVKNTDGTIAKKLTQGSAAAEGVFTYTPGTKTITFHTGDVEDGAEIVAYYDRKIMADAIENLSDHYAAKVELYINGFAEDKCGNIYQAQVHYPKANMSGEFSLELSDSQTVHSFEAEALATGCGGASILWGYTIFGAEAPDAA